MRHDLIDHFVICALLTLALGLFMGPVAAAGVALAIGLAKEAVWDWALKRGTADWSDVVANVGGASAAALLIAFSRLVST